MLTFELHLSHPLEFRCRQLRAPIFLRRPLLPKQEPCTFVLAMEVVFISLMALLHDDGLAVRGDNFGGRGVGPSRNSIKVSGSSAIPLDSLNVGLARDVAIRIVEVLVGPNPVGLFFVRFTELFTDSAGDVVQFPNDRTLEDVDVSLVRRHHNWRRLPLAVPCYCSIDCGKRIEAIRLRATIIVVGAARSGTRCVMMGHRCSGAAGTGACVAMCRSVRVAGMRMWLGGSRSGSSSAGGLAKCGCAARTDSTGVCAGGEGRARLRRFLRRRARWDAAGPTRLRHADGSTVAT